MTSSASTHIFSHLFRSNPCFDFEAVIAPIPEVICDALREWVEDHVDALSAQFIPDNSEDRRGAEENKGNNGDGSGDTSP